jgi:DNA polymerase I-like protein with 3'-5' exonuclease and polymerase domains
LDPEKVRSVVEGAGQAYPILRTVTELEAALAAYHGLVGLDVEARDTELTAPLEALQLALYPVDREPILAVLHWPQWGEAPGAPLPVCLVRQLQRPDLIPVGHNISTYDLPILARHGCDLTNRPTIDTMVQERVLLQGQFRDEERAGKGLDYPGLGLSDCLLRRLRVWLGKAAQQKGIGARLAAPTMCEDDLRYCALDILFLGALVTMQWRHATERQRHAMKLETEVQSLLTGITVRGLAVNLERLAEAREEQLEKMPEPLAHIRELLPEVRMTASGRLSDKSLSTLIERDYGIDPASRAWGAKENREREREGKAPLPPRIFLNEQVRTEVRMENYAWKDVAEPLDAYKQADSLAARLTPTYLKVLEGRIFPRVIGLATRNWRMTMVEPNAQQIAHDYRDVVVADASCVFVSVDLSQIEARLAAVVSQDEAMLHATEHDDVYLAIAAHHHGVDMDGLDPARRATLRKSSKIIVLALQYGGGTQAVRAQMLAQNKPCSVDDAKCKIDEYMQRFPGVKRMVERAWAEERGCREHRRGLAIDYTSGGTRTFRTEELKGTKFTPARISSLAATAFKLSLLLLKDRGWGPYLAMVLHDEISLHVPRHMSQQAARDLVECLTQGVALVCPEANARVGDPVIGKTWSKKGDDLGPGDEVSDEGEA